MVKEGNTIAARCSLLIMLALSLGCHYIVPHLNVWMVETYRPQPYNPITRKNYRQSLISAWYIEKYIHIRIWLYHIILKGPRYLPYQNLTPYPLHHKPLNLYIGLSPQMEQPYSSMVLSFPYMTHFIKCPYTRASIVYKDLHPSCTLHYNIIRIRNSGSWAILGFWV